jgi:hypothetical protein
VGRGSCGPQHTHLGVAGHVASATRASPACPARSTSASTCGGRRGQRIPSSAPRARGACAHRVVRRSLPPAAGAPHGRAAGSAPQWVRAVGPRLGLLDPSWRAIASPRAQGDAPPGVLSGPSRAPSRAPRRPRARHRASASVMASDLAPSRTGRGAGCRQSPKGSRMRSRRAGHLRARGVRHERPIASRRARAVGPRGPCSHVPREVRSDGRSACHRDATAMSSGHPSVPPRAPVLRSREMPVPRSRRACRR